MKFYHRILKEFIDVARVPLDFLRFIPWIYRNRFSVIMFDRLTCMKPRLALMSAFKKPRLALMSALKKPLLVPMKMMEHKRKEIVKSYIRRISTPDCFKADLQLICYLRTNFKKKQVKKLEKKCHSLVVKLYENCHLSMEELSVMVQGFYDEITELAQELKPISPDFCSDEFLERIEDFVSVRAYGVLFSKCFDDDTHDLSLQSRIKTLNWDTQGFLETVLDFGSEAVKEHLMDAMIKISEMNSYKRIKEKFDCLLECAQKIFEAIRESTNSPASADEFLPVLIYIILKSNPALMHSNLCYIRYFSVELRTFTGETGYYFTNLCSAIHYIQELNADSLC